MEIGPNSGPVFLVQVLWRQGVGFAKAAVQKGAFRGEGQDAEISEADIELGFGVERQIMRGQSGMVRVLVAHKTCPPLQAEARMGQRITLVAGLTQQQGAARICVQGHCVVAEVRNQRQQLTGRAGHAGNARDHWSLVVWVLVGQRGKPRVLDQTTRHVACLVIGGADRIGHMATLVSSAVRRYQKSVHNPNLTPIELSPVNPQVAPVSIFNRFPNGVTKDGAKRAKAGSPC